MASILIDEGRWPIVVITWLGVPRDQDFLSFLRRLEEFVARDEPFAVVFDTSHAGIPPRRYHEMQVEWDRRNAHRVARLQRGAAFVIKSPLVRILLQGYLLIQPLPCPSTVTSTLGEALEWAGERVRPRDEGPGRHG